ncbi:cell division protein FtsL [Pediococcus acidilactici]
MAQNNDYAGRSRMINEPTSIAGVGKKELKKELKKAREVVTARQLPLSKFEKFLITFCGFILVGLMLTVVSGKISLSNAQHKLEATQEKTTALSSKNTTMKQEVNQLSDQNRLNKVAKKAGLSLNSENIRNVNK